MSKPRRILALLLMLAPLPSCSGAVDAGGFGGYGLIRASRPVNVGNGGLAVTAPRDWNRASRFFFDNVRQTEDWTLNGPYLDGITFVSGLPGGHYLVQQRKSDNQQVPKFRSDMTAPEVAAMLESAYRVRGGAVEFRTLALTPRIFMGYPGFQFDYEHLDTDELWRKGRAVGAVINGRLYLILYDAARSHYYANAITDFEAMTATARLRR